MYIYISAGITYNISFAVNAKQVRPTPWEKKTPLPWDPPTPNKPQTLWGNEKRPLFFFKTSYQVKSNKSKLDFQHIYTYTVT